MQDFAALRIKFARKTQLCIARPIRPEGQQMAVFPREIEQDCEHARGKLDRDFLDPIKCLSARQTVEQFAGAHADFFFHPLHFGWRKGWRDRAPLAGVFGPVHGDEHRQLETLFTLGEFFFPIRIADCDPALFPV